MARAKSTKTKIAKPIHVDARTCFAIAYFLVEADAQAFGDYYRKHGHRYIGGYFDGMPTGRDSSWDMTITEEHQKHSQPWYFGEMAKLPVGTKVYAATY